MVFGNEPFLPKKLDWSKKSPFKEELLDQNSKKSCIDCQAPFDGEKIRCSGCDKKKQQKFEMHIITCSKCKKDKRVRIKGGSKICRECENQQRSLDTSSWSDFQ